MKFKYISFTSQLILLFLFSNSINCLSTSTQNQAIANLVLSNLKMNEKQFHAVSFSTSNVSNCACAQNIPRCCTPEYFKVSLYCYKIVYDM